MSLVSVLPLALLILTAGALGATGWAFRSRRSTMAATTRIRARLRVFRLGFLPLLAGVALTAEAEAILWQANLTRDDPIFMAPLAVGLVLIVTGLLIVNYAIWRPVAGADARPLD